MGILNKNHKADVKRLPTGTFTVDAQGQVISSTVPQSVSAALVNDIGRILVASFREAREAGMGVSELAVQYDAFRIVAREMRGGAIIFLSPKVLQLVSRS
ncbi:MAG TPA: hypothetical protein VH595_02350 [Verrucomicrobiae bacterium]|jgi:hypothetical protein|nr:hypothetical protein [Verrucomicrobiae bacterium]